jgi:hypothetical protein
MNTLPAISLALREYKDMKQTIAVISLLVFPCMVHGEDFDYTFVQVGFLDADADVGPFDVDGDGFSVNGSFALRNNVHLVAGFTDQDYDRGIDSRLLSFGAGFNTPLSSKLDFVADLSYVDAEVATLQGSADETGYDIRAGVRALVHSKVELEGRVSYLDLDGSETSVHVGGRYYFNDKFAVGAGLVDNDGGLGWNIGVRAEFGR